MDQKSSGGNSWATAQKEETSGIIHWVVYVMLDYVSVIWSPSRLNHVNEVIYITQQYYK